MMTSKLRTQASEQALIDVPLGLAWAKKVVAASLFLPWLLSTAACNFTGYGQSQVPVIQPGATARTQARVEDKAPRAAPVVMPKQAPLTAAQLLPCPDLEVSRLIVVGEFDLARALLDEDLARERDEIQRSCILTTMGMLAASPDSSLYNPQQAQDYQGLARVNGAVENGSLALQMLDKSLSNLIAQQQQLQALGGDNDRLRGQLAAKEAALQKLKKLTLGNN